MLERARYDASQVRALVVALEQREITWSEFSDGVESLTPEAMQVTALLLREFGDMDYSRQQRLCAARLLCFRLASQSRVLS